MSYSYSYIEAGGNQMIIPINDITDSALDVYARLNEPQLVHINEPGPGLFITESPNVILRALDAGYEPVSLLLEDKHIDGEAARIIARCPDIPVYAASLDVLVNITGFQLTRGLLCAMRRQSLPSYEELIKNSRRIAVLEGVVNPTNIGAIFRSAAALYVDAVLLTPDCADPLYRRAARVSMGTVFQVPWTYIGSNRDEWNNSGIEILQQLGFSCVAMALKDNSIPIDDPLLKSYDKMAILLGAEGDGLSESTISKCDHSVIIPMSHNVDSLNVAAASAVAFWELCK